MASLRKCPVCRSTVTSSESTHCPECGAVLDHGFSDVESQSVDDIIRKVKQQIVPPDDASDAQTPGTDGVDGKDIAQVLSEAAFQSILNENRSDEISPDEDDGVASGMSAGQAAGFGGTYQDQSGVRLDGAGEERTAPFSTVLGSFKQSQSSSEKVTEQSNESAGSPVDDKSHHVKSDRDRPVIERPDPVRPPSFKDSKPKKRTWWGSTRQILWLLFALLLCIVFFRIFGPERKKPTIEDFFRPGNPDIEFLDAVEFLEKYYEKQREQNAGNIGIPVDETAFDSVQPTQAVDGIHEVSSGQASDNTTIQGPDAPASKETTF